MELISGEHFEMVENHVMNYVFERSELSYVISGTKGWRITHAFKEMSRFMIIISTFLARLIWLFVSFLGYDLLTFIKIVSIYLLQVVMLQNETDSQYRLKIYSREQLVLFRKIRLVSFSSLKVSR